MSGNVGRRGSQMVLVLFGALFLVSLLLHGTDPRILLTSPLLVAMWVASYLAHRADPSTRRRRRLDAVVLALAPVGILATVVIQYLLEGVEPLHILFVVLAVALALGALWYWRTAARMGGQAAGQQIVQEP